MDANRDATQTSFFPSLRRRAKYSTKGDGQFYRYSYFRKIFQNEIAEDCLCKCVYCDSHENEMGGRDLMQIDHFRPYTRQGFEGLENDPHNFNHACGRCNLLKSDKWPSTHPTDPHDGVVGFIDPFADDRRLYFSVESDGELTPLRPPAKYLIRVLALNRPHLKLLRTRRIYQLKLRFFFAENLPRWEEAAQGKGKMTKEQLGKALIECKRLCEQCSIV
jgi:hypothetical protein